MTAARHYSESVVLVEHHAPLCNPGLYGKQTQLPGLLILHVLRLYMQNMVCFILDVSPYLPHSESLYYYTIVITTTDNSV